MLILMILLLVTVDLVKTPCFSSYNIFFAFLRNSIGAIPRVNVNLSTVVISVDMIITPSRKSCIFSSSCFSNFSNFAFFKNSFVTVIHPS